jgi:LysM repeat protein
MQNKADCPYFGVDFSSLDNIVDQELLFSQIDFMWCRAYGRDHTGSGDSQTVEFVTAARAHGIPVGCYYFGFPIVDAAAGISTDAEIIANAEVQAQQFIDKLYSVFGQGQVGDLIPILDLEQYKDIQTQYGHTATNTPNYPQAVMSAAQITTWTLAFKNYFNSVTGWRLGLYTGEYWIKAPNPTEGAGLSTAQLQSLSPVDDPMPLWVARYDEYQTPNDTVPNFGNWTEFIAWQYTGTGNAAAYGIANDPPDDANNYLDLNRASSLEPMYAQMVSGETLPPAKYIRDQAMLFTSIEYETSLQVPNNYGKSAGNFDEMGLSHGCIQFPLGWGTLQGIWKDLYTDYFNMVKSKFTVLADFTTWEDWLWNKTIAEQIAFADTEFTDWKLDEFGQRIPASGHNVKEPWKTYFMNLGITPESQARQQLECDRIYHPNALKWFKDFGLWTRRGYCLCWEISVQSGSINPLDTNGNPIDVMGRIFTRFSQLDTTGLSPEEIEIEKMKLIIDERSKEVSATWRPSWIERKSSAALGRTYVSSYVKWVDPDDYDMTLTPAFAGFTKTDLHVATSGETFTTLAEEYNTTAAELEALNPQVSPLNIYTGLSINVPYQETAVVSPGKIHLGSLSVNKIYLGSAEVTNVYLGSTEIYSPAPTLPVTTISPAEVIQNDIPITITLTCDDPTATIYYKIGTQAEKVYTDPFTANQSSATVNNTQIPITYWAVSANGTEEQKTITYDTTGAVPSKPVLTVTAEEGQVILSWTGATNTTSYTVFRSTTSGDTGTILAGTQYMTARTWTDTTVTGGTTYYYTVQAGNFYRATNSDQKAATPTAPVVEVSGYRYARQWMKGGIILPSTVTNLNSMIEFQIISASAGNVLLGKPNLEGYPAKLAGTSNPASNITDGVTADMWSYAVWSDSTDGLAHVITYDMGALYTDITEAKTWHNYASAGRFYNFKIEVCATNSPNDADWTTIIDAMDNSTAQIYEESSAGFTFPMPVSYGTPEKPLLELTNLTNAVRLDWQPTAETTSFKLYRTSNPDNLGPMLEEVTPETTTYTDTTALGGNTYYYTVKAVNPSYAKNSDKRTGAPYSILVYESKNVDFEGKANWTVYDATQVTADFGNADTVQGGDRLKIDTSGRLRFDLPAGVVGSANAGGIIKAKIAGKNEYTFEYEIRFDSGFPWSKGGKVPGFSGGKGYTGGDGNLARTLGDGFSVRMMWREDGRIIPYVYHAGMKEGEDYGDTFGLTLGNFTNTTAHTVKYYAKLNTGSDANGILRIYLDGAEVMNKTNLLYRTNECKIDTAHLALFPGGSTADWNMTAQGYVRLSNFSWI